MPWDVLPPVELIEGPCKWILTEKAREAAEVPVKCVKPRPATVKALASASAVSGPAASMKSSSLSVAVPVSVPDVPDSILNTVSKHIPICPSDYTNDDYDWGTDHYSLPLPSLPPAPTSPTQYETNDNANAINIDSDADDVRVKRESTDTEPESADAELGM
jgi:hypothetical protein